MAPTVSPAPIVAPLERLEALRPSPAKAKFTNREIEWRLRVGAAIRRAIAIAGLSLKEAAALIGRDVAQLGRWTSGAERPQLDTLLAADELRGPLLIALATLSPDIAVETVITLRRTA